MVLEPGGGCGKGEGQYGAREGSRGAREGGGLQSKAAACSVCAAAAGAPCCPNAHTHTHTQAPHCTWSWSSGAACTALGRWSWQARARGPAVCAPLRVRALCPRAPAVWQHRPATCSHATHTPLPPALLRARELLHARPRTRHAGLEQWVLSASPLSMSLGGFADSAEFTGSTPAIEAAERKLALDENEVRGWLG